MWTGQSSARRSRSHDSGLESSVSVSSVRRMRSVPADTRRLIPARSRKRDEQTCHVVAADEEVFAVSLSNNPLDACAFTTVVAQPTSRWAGPRRVAVVGGGPAGLCAAIALIRCSTQPGSPGTPAAFKRHTLPSIVVSIFEKRAEPIRRQHVYLGFDRLGLEARNALQLDLPRLEALLQARGVSAHMGSSLELRTLESCLQILLKETAAAASGEVVVRWFPRSFGSSDVDMFEDVIGSDGRRSAVRTLLMANVPKVWLAQRALEIEFEYNCHLEWQPHEGVHTLKQHRYDSWQPCLLYIRPDRRQQGPDYVQITQSQFEVVDAAFRRLVKDGKSPFTTPFSCTKVFLDLLSDTPVLQASICEAIRSQVEDFQEDSMAVITPVEQTLHRAPLLVSPACQAGSSQSLWLLGDAAVGLPVAKGCNLIYHMASAGKLGSALLAKQPQGYEQFVFGNWHQETWRERSSSHATGLVANRLACFDGRRQGRFTS